MHPEISQTGLSSRSRHSGTLRILSVPQQAKLVLPAPVQSPSHPTATTTPHLQCSFRLPVAIVPPRFFPLCFDSAHYCRPDLSCPFLLRFVAIRNSRLKILHLGSPNGKSSPSHLRSERHKMNAINILSDNATLRDSTGSCWRAFASRRNKWDAKGCI